MVQVRITLLKSYKKLNVDDLSPCSWSQLTCVYEALG
ncbi:unnamed protein product, partial [Iphiclides podalirius]